jgi:branched-chain amino acid transport system permease protein
MRVTDRLVQFLAPAALVCFTALLGSFSARTNEVYFETALVDVAIVVGLYLFVGNSGVLSFGHISFVAVGAWTAGVFTVPSDVKSTALPDLFPFLADHTVGNLPSLLLATAAGGVFAFLVGLPLMRLSGLAAGIATFAVLGITYNVLLNWTKIGPGPGPFTLVPQTTGIVQALAGALIAIAVAWLYQLSRFGRLLRASREDPAVAQAVGVRIHVQRLGAFTVSGALCGFAGGLLVHELGGIYANQVYLDLTFITLAMLVVGGVGSLLGAVVGALLISGLNSFLSAAEGGVHVVGVRFDVPSGTNLVVLGAVMAIVLVLRPSGITGGRELPVPRMRGRPPREAPATGGPS